MSPTVSDVSQPQAPGRDAFEEFSSAVFAALPRADQRRWAEVYLQGLLTLDGRKSIRRMAERQPGWGADATQSLQHFVNQSPWDWSRVSEAVGSWVTSVSAPRAWVVETAVIPKRGTHSVGVCRRYSADQGRAVNGQFGMGGFIATDLEALPVEWRLVLERGWTSDAPRKSRARIPAGDRARPLWEYVLEVAGADCRPGPPATVPVVTDLRDELGVDQLIMALRERRDQFVVGVGMSRWNLARVHPADPRHGAPGQQRGTPPAGGSEQGSCPVGPADGDGGEVRRTQFASQPVRLPGGSVDSVGRVYWMTPEDAADDPLPHRYWITNITHLGTHGIVELVSHLQRAKRCVRALAEEFGMCDFEGRSFPGWHHHMTLVSAACVCRRTTGGPGPATRD
ncbi:IS701 family transposase [Streptomyces polygonati]|uniref:IS701 family transposase n=1 Tax=Streptomyces polygonati TaxID=1617087 RepID=A0ABV8HUG8_9ACTN